MNALNFTTFSQAYREGLLVAVKTTPGNYALARGETVEQYVEKTATRMLSFISGGLHLGVNYSGDGFRRACRTIGIKHTRKAILNYLEIK